MASDEFEQEPAKRADDNKPTGEEPGWANGLRQLYDAVVDEPLPDSFKDLLAQLDDGDEEGEDKGGESVPSSGAEGSS
ncbi:NepR family anti-sigma factor [Erythrobacter sp. THAF29]|uniref:NepR family anti-sigma factor n=1 Tax=Erythrobacter sp. THAF29 TaxID=2587851 RepID=UPI001267FA42|nr:NepR family anti-sigma factor [Erythrobacter sp. THAF29]QFT78897.1 hypothetical protein FIU90_15215 [Erythrobacter sp. THAF29]